MKKKSGGAIGVGGGERRRHRERDYANPITVAQVLLGLAEKTFTQGTFRTV